ncbi:hypothetical protein ACFCXR_40135 [Streptomyces noursei]|uniref:hypothetical protein n=1 Tax=Streptomyces noursei TaxID=1971 RepID=UPI0035DCD6EF
MADDDDREQALSWLDNLVAAGSAVRNLRGRGTFVHRLTTATGDAWLWGAHRVLDPTTSTITVARREDQAVTTIPRPTPPC